MADDQSYWSRTRLTRRRALGSGLLTTGGLAFAVACGGGSNNKSSKSNAAPAASVAAAAGTAAAAGGTAAAVAATAAPTVSLANAKKGGTLNLLWNVADAQMDPHTTTEHFSPELWRAASHGLLRQEALTNKAVPDLASAWENPDPLTYTFHLEPAAKWQNKDPMTGRPVTAEDVIYSLKRISTPDPSHPRASSFSSIDSYSSPDEHTLVVKLKEVYVPILTPLSDKWTVIVPHEVVDKFGDLKRGDSIIGCGPFICQNADSSKGATLVRNPDYWRPDRPFLDKIVYTTILDEQAAHAAFRAGQADISLILPDLTKDSFKANDVDLRGYSPVDMGLSLIGGPVDKAPLSDERVRQAINLAIDRDALAEAAFPGAEYTQAGVLDIEFWGLPSSEIVKIPGFGKKSDADYKQAKQLIDAAGVAGTEITLNTTKAYHPYHSDRAEALAPMFEKIGLKVKLNVLDFAGFKDVESKKAYQMTAASYSANGDPDIPLTNQFTSKGTRNYWNWSDPTYDAMVAKQRQEQDFEKRKAQILDIQRYLLKGTPVAHDQFYKKSWLGVRKRVHNFPGTLLAGSSTSGWYMADVWVDA